MSQLSTPSERPSPGLSETATSATQKRFRDAALPRGAGAVLVSSLDARAFATTGSAGVASNFARMDALTPAD
jgi:hypothetical protein